jgi:hypothetical protein
MKDIKGTRPTNWHIFDPYEYARPQGLYIKRHNVHLYGRQHNVYRERDKSIIGVQQQIDNPVIGCP